MTFREDINGLRAVAVAAVAVFHFGPKYLPGGFSGVDIFFVISGYLMTGIILGRIESGSFSLVKFYQDRARRIIPALIFMCIVILALGWFLLGPPGYRALSKHAASSVGFVSNFVFLGESGYFDTASHRKLLLHTWSLSTEWQFYLIYPLALIFVVKKFSIQALKRILVFSTVVFFIVNLCFSYWWPEAAYFLLPSRLWEMTLGGVAFCFPFAIREVYKKRVEVTGLILILISCLFLSSALAWPGYAAIVPTLGTYLVIQANSKRSVLRLKPIQLIGFWSYSIYLWHWPIALFVYHSQPTYFAVPGLALATFFGFLSYKYIERGYNSKLKILGSYVALFLVVISVTFFGRQIYNVPESIWDIINMDRKTESPYTFLKIRQLDKIHSFSNSELKKLLIIGDSQAADITNSFYGRMTEYELVARVVPSQCGMVFGSPRLIDQYLSISTEISEAKVSKKTCQSSILDVNRGDVVEKADYIVIAMHWRPAALPFVVDSLRELGQMTEAKIFVMGQKAFKIPIPKLIYKHYLDKIDLAFSDYAYSYIRKEVAKSNMALSSLATDSDITFINMIDIMCPSKKCHLIDEEGSPLYYDSIHLTKTGSDFLGDSLLNIMFSDSVHHK